jgi:hypothetical protein
MKVKEGLVRRYKRKEKKEREEGVIKKSNRGSEYNQSTKYILYARARAHTHTHTHTHTWQRSGG